MVESHAFDIGGFMTEDNIDDLLHQFKNDGYTEYVNTFYNLGLYAIRYAEKANSESIKYCTYRFGVVKLLQTYMLINHIHLSEHPLITDDYSLVRTSIKNNSLFLKVDSLAVAAGFSSANWWVDNTRLICAKACIEELVDLFNSGDIITKGVLIEDLDYGVNEIKDMYKEVLIRYMDGVTYEFIFSKVDIFEVLMNYVSNHPLSITPSILSGIFPLTLNS